MSYHRDAFLTRIAANPDDEATRGAYADWLDEEGDYDEAQRQRDWKTAKEWLANFAAQHGGENEFDDDYYNIGYGQLVELGTDALKGGEVGFNCGPNQAMQEALQEHQQEFWRHLSVVTGLPLPPDFEERSWFGCAC